MIAPTIIIGLGGIGSDICCRVSKLVENEDQRRRIKFVCIDTDINDLANRRAEDSRIITIQTSQPYIVGNYLETNVRAREEWFPVHNILMGKTPTEGAGQVRAISRMAFEEAVREGELQKLNKTIETLFYLDGASGPQAMRVIIVSTLAGGTGSGIVLPVALYIRNFLETRFRKSASVVRGFFLLPEILFGNKSPEECSSLCCNAYASLRELDAFMRRGDGALAGPKYKDLKLELPDASTGNYVDYRVSPFNFCFLYDKRNTEDQQLKSFDDYKDHAANTIYAQAVSSMSNRSNSNEDNAIKALVSSNGRNRFCGAGSSLLQYPRNSVLRYIAGKWCVQVMDENWLAIDREYRNYVENQKELRKKNPSIKDAPLSDYYIERVDNSEKESFERQIFDMCHKLTEDEEGAIQPISNVDLYTAALTGYISAQIGKDPDLREAERRYNESLDPIDAFLKGRKDDGDDTEKITNKNFVDKARELIDLSSRYVISVKQAATRLGRTLSMQLFQDARDYTDDNKEYRMEYHMKDEDKHFIHPNAARYFVYCLRKRFNAGIEGAADQLETLQAMMNAFDKVGTAKIETGEDEITEHAKEYEKIFGGKARENLIGKTKKQHDSAREYAEVLALKMIYEEGSKYLQELSNAFEKFYENFEGYLKDTRYEVADIERNYVNGVGRATRYVCASQKCLEGMLNEMPCTGESSSINGTLSATIFQEMKSYAMLVRKPTASMYFENLYKKKILEFWEDRVLNSYEAKINMDILTALESEADYESDDAQTQEQKSMHAAKVLEQAERLAAPFIEEPMGEIRHPFTICAYNSKVMGAPDSARRSFVRKYLNEEMGGQPDDNVSPYELMVYKAIYNLNAGDLKRFRAPEGNNKQGGEYYAAYIDTVSKLGPDTNTNKVLTPHIDRHWHLVKYMPDLDDRNQSILEDKQFEALLWGMITGKIEQKEEEKDGESFVVYRPRTKGSKTFVVSNGTICDELYEVVDALAINPPQVNLIIEDMQNVMRREKQDRIALSESRLMNSMNWFDQKAVFDDDGYGLDEDEREISVPFTIRQYVPNQRASVFDLLYWIKVSTPADDFSEDDIELIMNSLFRLLERYVVQFVGQEALYDKCYNILVDQFKLFLNNLTDPVVNRPRPRRRLSDECVSVIRDQLSNHIQYYYKLNQKKCQVFKYLYSTAEERLENSTK